MVSKETICYRDQYLNPPAWKLNEIFSKLSTYYSETWFYYFSAEYFNQNVKISGAKWCFELSTFGGDKSVISALWYGEWSIWSGSFSSGLFVLGPIWSTDTATEPKRSSKLKNHLIVSLQVIKKSSKDYQTILKEQFMPEVIPNQRVRVTLLYHY